MGTKLRINQTIQRIDPEITKKFHSQFADDLWAAVHYHQPSLNELVRVMEEFSRYSGLTINYEKTQVLRIGGIHNMNVTLQTDKPLQWVWSMKVLGINFMTDFEEMRKVNFNKLLEKTKAIAKTWSLRSLTLIGKIMIVNTLIVSQYVCKFMCTFSPTSEMLKQFKQVISQFPWSGKKKAKISYKKLIQPYHQGGLKLVDLEA